MNPSEHIAHITGGGLFAVPGSGLFRVITWRDYPRRQQLIPAFTSPKGDTVVEQTRLFSHRVFFSMHETFFL